MAESSSKPPTTLPEPSGDRLDSWKEIAAYLRRDERTVRRWEKEGLPVHRHAHKKQASVYAYRAEIDAWWNDGKQRLEQDEEVAPRKKHLWWTLAVLVVAGLVALFALYGTGFRTRMSATPAAPTIRSIAVLPLENLTGDSSQEYFVDGMTDALVTDLGKIGELRVISRTSVLRYKGTKKSLPEIARELQVDELVEGTVSRSGNRVRITASLVQASPEKHLWADSFERDLRDVLALQDDVSRAIVNRVQIKLTSREQARLAATHPVNPEAYEAYLEGRYFWEKLWPVGDEKVNEYFELAIQKDPTWALPYSGMADSYVIPGSNAALPNEFCRKAKTAALEALKRDEDAAEAHKSLADVEFWCESCEP